MIKELSEEMQVDFIAENLEQPIICEINKIDKYGNGTGKYTTGFDIGDPIHVRMLGTHNYNVFDFKITEIHEDHIIAIHPRTGNEYKIGFDVEVSYAKELRFEPYKSTSKESHWFAFLYLDKEMEKQLITYDESLSIAKLNEAIETLLKSDEKPEGFQCSDKVFKKLQAWVKPEHLDMYKDWDDESIKDMLRNENRLARKQH